MYWCYYVHTSRDSLSPICGIFILSVVVRVCFVFGLFFCQSPGSLVDQLVMVFSSLIYHFVQAFLESFYVPLKLIALRKFQPNIERPGWGSISY